MASWADRAIWWHVYPLGFTGAEKAALAPDEPVRHRLGQLAAWLDYAVDLGCSGLLLGPVFAAESHGYDTSADAGSVLVLLKAGDAEFRFPVEVTGLTVAETPARPEDPALVRGHSWVIMSS